MSNVDETIQKLLTLGGAKAVAIVDSENGLMLGGQGSGVDLELAAAGNTEVVRAKLNTIKSLGLNQEMEDILISLGSQYHIISLSKKSVGVFIYVVLDRSTGNLALARRAALDATDKLELF